MWRQGLLALVCALASFGPASGYSGIGSYRGVMWRFLDQWQDSSPNSNVIGGPAVFPSTADSLNGPVYTGSYSRMKAGGWNSSEATATFTARRTLPPRRITQQAAGGGLCSEWETAKMIDVNVAADIAKRLQFGPTTTVILQLRKNLVINKGIVFDGRYSCTIFRSGSSTGFSITHSGSNEPVLHVANTSNVLVHGIDWKLNVRTSSPACRTLPDMEKGVQCPTIFISRSYGVQVAKGSVFGRVDIMRSVVVRIDSMKVTGISAFKLSPGVIRVAFCGYGPTLVKAFIMITNNEVYGVAEAIVLHKGAVGIIVRNNYVHDYIFSGIRCGSDVHWAGDCMLTSIDRNLVVSSSRNRNGDHDSAGIYWCIHWFSPGNTAECNYIFGGDHCYYLDYVSSGLEIRGGACINTWDGMKVNNGKKNIIEGVLMKNLGSFTGWSACLTRLVDNCGKNPGNYWEMMRKEYYDTDVIKAKYGWWKDVCADKSINGKPCNLGATTSTGSNLGTKIGNFFGFRKSKGKPKGKFLTAAQTGACSGLPTENYLHLINLNVSKDTLGYKYCEDVPGVEKGPLNIQKEVTPDIAAMKFTNYKADDLGVGTSSVIYKSIPKYKNCPRADVEPRRIDNTFYYDNFNHAEPSAYKITVGMKIGHQINGTLAKLSKQKK